MNSESTPPQQELIDGNLLSAVLEKLFSIDATQKVLLDAVAELQAQHTGQPVEEMKAQLQAKISEQFRPLQIPSHLIDHRLSASMDGVEVKNLELEVSKILKSNQPIGYFYIFFKEAKKKYAGFIDQTISTETGKALQLRLTRLELAIKNALRWEQANRPK